MNEKLQPFKVSPVFLEKIWGGQALRYKLNKKIDNTLKIGESWEVSGEEPYQSKICSGEYSGDLLSEYVSRFGKQFLGDKTVDSGFPLLFKFIDPNDKLSVQVHPDDKQTIENNYGIRGKTECWYVADALPGASLIIGLKKDCSRDELRSAIDKKTFRSLLNDETASEGDFFFIPPGTIHAIMPGSIIYEVQESSDITFRVYDWDRVDTNGKSRTLHIDNAVKVMDTKSRKSFKVAPVEISHNGYKHSIRVACRYFAVEQYSMIKGISVTLPVKQSFSVLTVIKGCMTLRTQSGDTLSIAHGESVCVPSKSIGCIVAATDKTELLCSSVPDIQTEIIDPLTQCGIAKKAIIALGGCVDESNDILKTINNKGS